MEEQNKNIMDLMLRPAFCVEAGIIRHVNPAAEAYLLSAGMPVQDLILWGNTEYDAFTGGYLYLTLQLLANQSIGATVLRMDQQDIFILEEPESLAELQTLALAAKELREPLAGIITVTDRLLPNAVGKDPIAQNQAAQLNRRVFQMMRMLGNMSDAYRYARPEAQRMEHVQIGSLYEEIFDRAARLLQTAGVHLQFFGLTEAVYTLACPERLERAAYNMLSNAAKFAPEGSCIQVRLSRKDSRVYLSISDQGPGIDSRVRGDLYSRYLREPVLEDLRNGIGLGMVLIRSTAALHGGAVMIDQPEGCGNRITMTLQIRQAKDAAVHSPAFRIDYAGEWDHALLELSDCLPASLYSYENI